MKLVVATHNLDKFREIHEILDIPGVELFSASDFVDLPEAEEDGDTLEANAMKKAGMAAVHTGLWAIADDTGLEVEALDGAPGVYSARFAGDDVSDEDNNEKLLVLLADKQNRRARFRTVVALSDPSGQSRWVQGECRGIIVKEKRGQRGFGYDPLFQPEAESRTFAEMEAKTKNQLSHRARALACVHEAWAEFLARQPTTWADGPDKLSGSIEVSRDPSSSFFCS